MPGPESDIAKKEPPCCIAAPQRPSFHLFLAAVLALQAVQDLFSVRTGSFAREKGLNVDGQLVHEGLCELPVLAHLGMSVSWLFVQGSIHVPIRCSVRGSANIRKHTNKPRKRVESQNTRSACASCMLRQVLSETVADSVKPRWQYCV